MVETLTRPRWSTGTASVRSRAVWIEQVGAVLCAVLGVVAICVAGYRLRHVFVGDAAVYLPFAQHTAEGHPFQFNLGQFSSGATSPLWGVLLGLPYVFALGVGGAKAFAAIATVAALLLTIAAARRAGGSLAAAAIASLFCVGAMTWYALTLYESAFVVAAVSLSLIATARAIREFNTSSRILATGPVVLMWAVLPLARPDVTVVALAEAVGIVLFSPLPRRQAFRFVLGALALAAIPAVLYYGYSLVDLGTFSTSASERTFALHEASTHSIGPLYLSGDAIRQLFDSFWLVAVLPGLAGLMLLARDRATRWISVAGALTVAAYVFLLTFVSPGLSDTPRYLLPTTPIFVIGTARALDAVRGRSTRLILLAVSALLIGGLSLNYLRQRSDWLLTLGLTNREVFERDVVADVNARAHPGDTLLAYEVQLRYYLRSDVSVLSEDGITDGRVRPYQRPDEIINFLRRYRPRWWIADSDVDFRRFLRGSVLDLVFHTFKRATSLRQLTIDGLVFRLIARRSRPLAPGFGGWQMLFEITYPRA